jgi:hypothetical protein
MKKTVLITIATALVVTSCLPLFFCLQGNGEIITQYRDVENFIEIENSTSINVTIIEADTFGLKMEIEENLADHIITSVTGGVLEIRHSSKKNCITHTITPSITISAPVISSLTISGSGDISAPALSGIDASVRVSGSGSATVGDIQTSLLQLRISGSGDISIGEISSEEVGVTISGSGNLSASGFASHGIFSLSGSGDAYTRDLLLNTASMTISGSGNIHTEISNSLNAHLSGSGNIYLRGNPTIHSNISGSGRIIKIN